MGQAERAMSECVCGITQKEQNQRSKAKQASCPFLSPALFPRFAGPCPSLSLRYLFAWSTETRAACSHYPFSILSSRRHVADVLMSLSLSFFPIAIAIPRTPHTRSLSECSDDLMNTLLTFVCQLVQRGDHALAKVLRSKTMEKMEARKAAQELTTCGRVHLPSISVSTKVSCLLDFKSQDLAEQMTIIDSHLFAKVEVAEALVWAREQREEVIPNLTKFTEHFNNMSYWVRTRILQTEEQKERERICMKFIKIMRSLKKLANFNSIFAILSALDSAPIRRLDWPRAITEGMKEFSALIDSSSSFRAYRQVLADTLPPCIPYM